MGVISDVLGRKDVVLIFAYAPTGLGHLRVTHALYEGLPKDVPSILLGSHDHRISAVHNFATVHPFTRSLLEFMQNDLEDVASETYKLFLRNNTTVIYEQLSTILEQRLVNPKTAVIIATHPTLEHQLAAIKDTLSKSKQLRVLLVVCVTDDTPQHIWYTPKADLLVVPSDRTRELLLQNAKKTHQPLIPVKVLPYPVSPRLGAPLSSPKLTSRKNQLNSATNSQIHICIPISGAAIGTDFYVDFISKLHTLSDRYIFHVISRIAPFTTDFLQKMTGLPYVFLRTSTHDREVVGIYEEVYEKQVIALEVTKPSEQAFKCLLKPTQTGGSILLFSTPVGRQEYDNVFFMRRHNLIPLESENSQLWQKSVSQKSLDGESGKKLLNESKFWRGVRLPENAGDAAIFTHWGLQNELFLSMARWQMTPRNENNHAHELTSDGVELFWKEVAGVVQDVA